MRDTGIGIPADRLDQLYEPFTQVDASTTRRYGGTGLGLVDSRRLVELMGGTLSVDSEEGRGSTFHFTVMLDEAPEPVRERDTAAPWLAGRRLLIVDDSATNRRILTLQAESWGLTAVDTGSPAEALAWIAAGEPFDLAVLDLHMPEIDGRALAARIRTHRAAAALPLVLFSSLGGGGDPDGADEPFAAVLTKPVKQSQLFDLLARLLSDAARGAPPAGRRTQLPRRAADPELGRRRPLRILLAKDTTVNQQLALLMLEQMGYRADVAADGVEAVTMVERHPYDVVLMHVQMPRMDGLEASRRIRHQIGTRPHIIAMTANAMQGDRDACLAAGMNDYVSKAVRPEELAAALGRVPVAAHTGVEPSASLPAIDDAPPAPDPAATVSNEPAGPAPSGPVAVLDPAALARLRAITASGPPDALARLGATLRDDTPRLLGVMVAAAGGGDASALERAAHTLNSNAAGFGAMALSEQCRQIELLARAGELAWADPLLRAAASEWQQMEAALDRLLEDG